MRDPISIPYDDLVEFVRTLQDTLFPNGEQSEWGSGTLGAIGGIFDDAGLSPIDPCEEHIHVSDPECESCNAESDARDATRMSGDPWEEDATYSLLSWRREVANEDTVLGYSTWCAHKRECDNEG